MIFKRKYITTEEFWNTVTHGFGAVLSVAALVLLLIYSVVSGSAIAVFSSLAFGLGLVLLYSASTVYHAVTDPKKKKILQKFDHLCIYLLIAGTYTPVMLLGLKGVWGWTMFGIIWGLVIIGFVFKFSPLRKNEKLSLILYALMGWMAVIAIKPLFENLSTAALVHLGLGGLAYTVGIYFFANHKIKFNHLIWHVFVLAGSIFHFIGVFFYIL